MKKRCWLALITALVLIALGGCAGAPQMAERYTLPAPTHAPPSISDSPAQARYNVVIDRLMVAGYLDAPGIVLQPDAIRLHQASNHQWAEALSRQLSRGLRQRLAAELPDTRILMGGNPPHALHLRVDVEQFQGRYDGAGVASGHWQVRDTHGDVLLEQEYSALSVLEEDGYPALVRALGKSWDKVAAGFATQIRRLRTSDTDE